VTKNAVHQGIAALEAQSAAVARAQARTMTNPVAVLTAAASVAASPELAPEGRVEMIKPQTTRAPDQLKHRERMMSIATVS